MLNDLDISKVRYVYLKPGKTDLRKGIDGLAAIVRSDLGLVSCCKLKYLPIAV